MVRPFDLRDLALVRRLSERGVSLHSVSALADDIHPLRGALMSMLVGGEFPTFVWKSDNGEGDGFIQLRVLSSSPHAFLLYLSPAHDLEPEEAFGENLAAVTATGGIWLALLDDAVAEIGQRGIQHVVAEVDEHGPVLPLLRRAGFAVYTRQDIWMAKAQDYRPPMVAETKDLTRRRSNDDWEIQLLYANTVPRLVQLVEPMPPLVEGENYVFRHQDELGAVVHVHRGSVATWLRFFIHPDAEAEAEAIVASAMELTFSKGAELVYCCVRRYESWLPVGLERCGFTVYGSQAVMVRHTVHHAMRVQQEPVSVLDGQRVTASAPMVRRYGRPVENGDRMRQS
jgi:hypothetical protein